MEYGSMVDESVVRESAEQIAKAIAHGRRLEALEILAQSERSVEALARSMSSSVSTVSAQLQVLRRAGLVRSRREGTTIHYRIAGPEVAQLLVALNSLAGTQASGRGHAREEAHDSRGTAPVIDTASLTGDAGAGCALRGRVPGRTSARRGLDPLGRAAAAVGGDPAGPQRRRVLPQRLVRDGAGGGAVPAPAGAGRRLDGRGRRGVARRAPDRPAGPRGLSTRSPPRRYQPAWSLVGAGLASLRSTVRPEAQVMPRGVTWVRNAVTRIDPRARRAHLADGEQITYETLVLATGIVLDWDGIPGLAEAMTTPQVSSNYSFDHAEKTWSILSGITAGTVVFTRAAGKVKCPSAAQKIMYLAADHWRRTGVLDRIRIVFVTPGERIYDKDEFSDTLDGVAADYGIEVRTRCELR